MRSARRARLEAADQPKTSRMKERYQPPASTAMRRAGRGIDLLMKKSVV
jgi:hypothetical protein